MNWMNAGRHTDMLSPERVSFNYHFNYILIIKALLLATLVLSFFFPCKMLKVQLRYEYERRR